MRKNIYFAIVIGAFWGITETTIGHFLHVFAIGIGWFIWFPVAFFFLNLIFKITGSIRYMLFTAFIPATLKLIDIFFTARIDFVINPAVSIILEALTVFAVYLYLAKNKAKVNVNLLNITLISFAWRILYIFYLLFTPGSWLSVSCLRGLIPFAEFFFLESVANIIFIYIFITMYNKLKIIRPEIFKNRYNRFYSSRILKPLFLAFVLISAIFLQIKL